ncbi:alcohol oxidase-like protein [Xylaria venustula]|nr:alcohol oxidase-like protein [Xylaria venustula]
MPLYTELPNGIDEVDIIVAGGGTAGCIVASRLSDADPNLAILLIERGSNNYNLPNVTVAFNKGSKEEQLANREIVVPSGLILGGGSSVNFLTYTPGEMLPYLKKLQTYHGPGPRDRGTYRVPRLGGDFIAAAKTLGYPELQDAQDLDSNNGVQRAMRYVSLDGLRQDVAHTYLHPRLLDGKHPTLHVVVESQVVWILFEDKKATGVEDIPNPDSQPNPTQTQDSIRRIRARKLVISSCGTFETPALLERSGIGSREILNRAGVSDVVAHVPGVGEAYSDYHLLVYSYRCSLTPEETLDALAGGCVDPAELLKNNDGMLGWNAMDITCKLRPSDADVAALGPKPPNKPLLLIFPSIPIGLPVGQYMALSDPIDFVAGFYSDPNNVDIKKIRPVCVEREGPIGTNVADIQYTREDDVIIEQWPRENVSATWHSLGTCKMAPLDQMGAVDASLNVHGVENLKIVDLSIPPLDVAANTNNTAMAIGEKAADIIIRELALG